MTSRRVVFELALSLVAVLAASCSRPSGTQADAATPGDQGVAWDVASDLGGATDASVVDALDDAADVTGDRGADAPSDVGVDARGPTGDAWAGVPLADLGGYLIPIDPSAVPAPGSECHGDAGVRAGDPAIAPPRPLRPLSVSRVTSQRPTFQWALPEGTTGARVEVCADRCCTRVLQTIDAEGTTVRPNVALPPGVVFWRMFGRRGTTVGSRASYTWEFEVRRRDAPNDTSWGTIRDFNGDGFDDLVLIRQQEPGGEPADLVLLPGSAEGLRGPVVTGVVASHVPFFAGTTADFNGDGLADVAWHDHNNTSPLRSWFETVAGSAGRMRSSVQPDLGGLGPCGEITGGAAVDWNGDGYSDYLVTVKFGCDVFVPPEASILLGYSGSPAGIATTPQWALRLDGRFNHYYVYLASGVGDLDNDGHGDVFVASRFAGAGTTSVPDDLWILHGTADGEPRAERFPEPTVSPNRLWAARPKSLGDCDGDGYLDLLLTIALSPPVYVYRHATGLASPSSVLRDPIGSPDFGIFASPGDIDGDGLSDAIISSQSAYSEVREMAPINVGRVYVFRGSNTGTLPQPITLERARPHMEEVPRSIFGSHPMSPGDLNGDGIDDITSEDGFGYRLCVRYGRTDFSSGSPEFCQDRVVAAYAEHL